MRGFAPAMRVMSRSEPPAFASGSWPSTRVAPAWLTIDVREHVRQVARQRDEPVVRGRVDRDRERAELGDEAVDERGAARRRSAAVGVRNHVAPSKSPAEACSAPRDLRAARSGGRRRSAASRAAAATTLAFVEPTSVTVVSSPVAASTAATCAGSAAIGAATTASSAPASASSSDARRLDRAARDRGRERVGSGSQPTTARPAPLRGQADRGADQPGADDREPLDGQGSPVAASARRGGTRGRATGAPFRRGSQSVS